MARSLRSSRLSRLALIALALGFVGTIGAATFSPGTAVASGACHRTKFDTKLIGDACKAGNQDDAKKAMQKFLKTAKKTEAGLECKGCHKNLSPNYDLKDDGLAHFKKLGGS